jgi:uncharacterized membrane protein
VVARAVTINKPRHELYAFWRDFGNLPRFMENVRAVSTAGDRTTGPSARRSARRSRW